MKPRDCWIAAALFAVCLAPLGGQEKAREEKVKIEVNLSTEHTPDGLKAGSRADLVMVFNKTVTGTGLVTYNTRPLVTGVDVVSVTRKEKPADPDKAVVVELSVTKPEADKIEQVKARLVTMTDRVDGKFVTRQRPVPLRLELLPAPKK